MNVIIANVSRNSFTDNKGKEVSYCKFTYLVPSEVNDNFTGYNIETCTTKYDNYDLIKPYADNHKSVNVEFSFSKVSNSNFYKAKPVKIGETNL